MEQLLVLWKFVLLFVERYYFFFFASVNIGSKLVKLSKKIKKINKSTFFKKKKKENTSLKIILCYSPTFYSKKLDDATW